MGEFSIGLYTPAVGFAQQNRDRLMLTANLPSNSYLTAWEDSIEIKLESKRYVDAMEAIEAYQKEAFSQNKMQQIAQSYGYLGSLYLALNITDLAIENYLKSAEYHEKNGTTNNASTMYRKLGEIYSESKEYPLASSYLYKSLALAKREEQVLSSMLSIALYYTHISQLDSAQYYLNSVDNITQREFRNSRKKQHYYRTLLSYTIEKGELQQALSLVDSLEDNDRFLFKSKIYKKKGEYKEALRWFRKSDSIYWNIDRIELNALLIEYTSRFEESRVELERRRLNSQNSELQIQQMNNQQLLLEAEQVANGLQLEATELELKNSEITNKQIAAKVEATQLEARREKERAALSEEHERLQRDLLISSIIFLFLFAISTFLYFLIRRRNTQQLKIQHNIATEAYREAEEARTEAELANQEKREFLQNISHEIRTPLNAIVGFSEILNSNDYLDITIQEREELLKLVQQNSDYLTTLVNSVLDISKIESNQYKLLLTKTDPNELCREALNSIKPNIPAAVLVKLDIPTDKRYTLYTDRTCVMKLLTNLLTNACKNTKEGTITIGYSIVAQGDIAFYVADTGKGIPIEKAEEIFAPYGKLDHFKQGAGLGLTMCRSIATLLTGKVYLDTSYQKGARFLFIHPQLS